MADQTAHSDHVVTFSDDNFQAQVIEASAGKPVLVDFFATWCGPCKAQTPIIEELAKEWKDKVVIGKLDVDESPVIAQQYHIMGIPSLKIFKGGVIVEEFTGLQQRETIAAALEKHL